MRECQDISFKIDFKILLHGIIIIIIIVVVVVKTHTTESQGASFGGGIGCESDWW